jgi:hypothetical protein
MRDTVFVLTAHHQTTPGVPLHVFKTMRAADVKAAELLNVMLLDADLPATATPGTWRADLEHLKSVIAECLGDENTPDVIIERCEVED